MGRLAESIFSGVSQPPGDPCNNFLTMKFLLAGLLVATSGIAFAADVAAPWRFASTLATARVEYWQTRQLEIAKAHSDREALHNCKLVFLGDSITDFRLMGDDLWVPGQRHGRRIWQESFAGQPREKRAINLGISGDRTEQVNSLSCHPEKPFAG